MKVGVSCLERAFELAATGGYSTVDGLVMQLHREGYVTSQVLGRSLRMQLLDRMRIARSLKETGPRAQKKR